MISNIGTYSEDAKPFLFFLTVLILLFVAGLADVHADRGVGGVSPFKEDAEPDVIVVCGKFPEEVGALFVGGDPDCDHFPSAYRDHGVHVLANLLLKVFDLRPGPHRGGCYHWGRVWERRAREKA